MMPTARCINRPDAYAEGTYYDVFCDAGDYPIRFIFERVGSGYYLTAIDNINE